MCRFALIQAINASQDQFRIFYFATDAAPPRLFIFHPLLYERLELCSKVGAMEVLLSDDRRLLVPTLRAVPAQTIHTLFRALTLHYHSDSIGESYW